MSRSDREPYRNWLGLRTEIHPVMGDDITHDQVLASVSSAAAIPAVKKGIRDFCDEFFASRTIAYVGDVLNEIAQAIDSAEAGGESTAVVEGITAVFRKIMTDAEGRRN